MSKKSPQEVRTKVRNLYGVGILVFTGIVGFITVLSLFLDHVKLG